MDILAYMNSHDLSAHLASISYQPTANQAAWIVFHSQHNTMVDKLEAWEWIISNMPDEEVPERISCSYRPSLHQALREYLRIIKETCTCFEMSEGDAVYRYRLLFQGQEPNKSFKNELFSSLPQCRSMVRKEIKKYPQNAINSYEIERIVIDKPCSQMTAAFLPSGELMRCESETLFAFEYDFFHGMWFRFPVPFQKGDLLILAKEEKLQPEQWSVGPFVLINGMFDPEIKEPAPPKGDETDMTCWGYFVTEDGWIFDETISPYTDLVRYRGGTEEQYSILPAISNYLQGNCNLCTLLNLNRSICMRVLSDYEDCAHDYSEQLQFHKSKKG